MAKLDEVERWALEQAVTQIQAVIANGAGASYGSTITNMLVRFVENAQRRLAQLEQSHVMSTEEERVRQKQDLAIAYLIQKESALNAAEREQYGIFLAKPFFEKSDFVALAGFYRDSWERLTEGGKAQMSHRIWEGVRQGQYQFGELPEEVKEKEAKRLYDLLIGGKTASAELENIRAVDRADFTAARNAGKKEEAFAVLARGSFKDNAALLTYTVAAHNGKDRDEADKAIGVTPKGDSSVNLGASTSKRSSDKEFSVDVLSDLSAVSKPTELPVKQKGGHHL